MIDLFANAKEITKKPKVHAFWIGVKGGSPIWGYKCKKWGQGTSGDKNARWRRGAGLAHGMKSTKFVIAKTATKGMH